METKQPTREQLREFWEWCNIPSEELTKWKYKGYNYPPLDLNNLFGFAVPKAIDTIQRRFIWTYRQAEKYLFDLWLSKLKTDDYTLALFWVIWEIIQNQTERQGDN